MVFVLNIGGVFAQRIPVRVVEFEVYEKEMEGYEFLLPASAATGRDSLVAYLAKNLESLTVFEDMIIAEEVRYPAVSIWQPVTLIFQIEPQSNLLTRVRAAALINYRQSVTVPETPDLALRMLLDLDQYCRRTTGDSLDFDILFQSITSQDLARQFAARSAGYKWNLYVDRKPEEVVEDAGLYLRNRTGLSSETPAELLDEEVMEEVSRRFQVYVQSSESPAFLPPDQAENQTILLDSIAELNRRLLRTQAKIAQSMVRIDSLTDSKPSTELEGPQPIEPMIQRDTIYIESVAESNDREQQLLRENQSLIQQILEKDQELGVVFSRMERLERQVAALQAGMEDRAEPQDSLIKLKRLLEETEDEADNSVVAYQQTIDSLQELIVTLNPESDESKARRAIYLRQLSQLQTAQNSLVERGWEVSMREKRVGQREKFLADQEEDAEKAALIQRIADLEVQLLEGSSLEAERSTVRIEPGVMRMGEQEIPAFSLRTTLPASWAKEQLLAWCRIYNLKVRGEEVLMIQSHEIPGMENVRYTWQTTLLERESGAILYVTFQTPDGRYLSIRDGSLESKQAIRLLQEVFQ